MKTKKLPLLPILQRSLNQVGENIKLARQRRNLTTIMVAKHAGISRLTLHAIESGQDRVAIGSYIRVMAALGLEKEFTKLAADDEFGRKLQDAKLLRSKK